MKNLLYVLAAMLCFCAINFSEKNLNAETFSESYSVQTDSLQLKMFLADREYFLKLQETVSSKNQYIGLQWCVDLLNKYIELEQKKLSTEKEK